MSTGAVLAFWGVTALLIVVPGPDWAYAVSAGLRGHVVPAVAGIVLGYLAMTAVVAAGVGALVAATPVALTLLTVAGGGYLIWLGIRTWRQPAGPAVPPGPATDGWPGALLHGMAVSGLNPKGLLIFVVILPQFTDRSARWPVPVQLAVLGLTFAATCAVVYLAVGAGARCLRQARPSAARLTSRVSGASMVVIGAVLLIERL